MHRAEDSNDKERGNVPKMINDLLLSEKHNYRSFFRYILYSQVSLEFVNPLGYFLPFKLSG